MPSTRAPSTGPEAAAGGAPLAAILGGPSAVKTAGADQEGWPALDGRDEAAVLEVLRSGNISTHPVLRQLEEDYKLFTGMPHALAHCNGTAALMAAFFALDLKPGDEVIVPSATFWASALPMLWMGALPVFCDSEAERLGPDPEDIERRITPRTRAIVVVHLWGLPARMSRIYAVAKRHGLAIVEDASHAHGASWRGRPCGSLGDLAVFSLQGDKLAPAGEGGVLLCRQQAHFERAACLGDIARVIELDGPARRFAATGFGMKTRMAPLCAAVARTQLARLEEHNRRRNASVQYVSQALEELGFGTFLPPDHVRRVYFEFLVRCDEHKLGLPLDRLIEALRREGCQVSRPRYPLLHQQPFFTEGHFAAVARLPAAVPRPRYDPADLPRTQALAAGMLRLPVFWGCEQVLLDQYIAAFGKVVGQAGRIAAL